MLVREANTRRARRPDSSQKRISRKHNVGFPCALVGRTILAREANKMPSP